jgi:hypothetical protein
MNEPGTESGNLTRMAILALGESLAADRASPAEEVRADVAELTASAADPGRPGRTKAPAGKPPSSCWWNSPSPGEPMRPCSAQRTTGSGQPG